MIMSRLKTIITHKSTVRCFASVFLASTLILIGVGSNHNAQAYGDTRTISLFYTHTKDTLNITYKRNGYFDQDALKQLNYFLRDWRRDEPTSMDPKLFDALWEVYREAGYEGQTINVVSAYRSPETNGMLRRRSRAVAKHSQHMLGKAMDTTMPGVSMGKIREIGVRLQRGGVGYYPSAGTPFVHLDVGGVRAWPRLSTSQLVRLFPDQRTVHLPSDGPPLAGYQEAMAEIERNGGSIGGSDEEEGSGRGLFAMLFGGGSSSKSSRGAPSRSSNTQLAMNTAPVNNASGDDSGAKSFFLNNGIPERASVSAQANRITRIKIEPKPVQSLEATPAIAQPEPIQQPQIQLASLRPRSIEDDFKAAKAVPEAVQPKDSSLEPPTYALVPLPPRRPNEAVLLASLGNTLALTDVPLPPMRPEALSFTTASVAAIDTKPVPLPPIILGRPAVKIKSNALGFAETDTFEPQPNLAPPLRQFTAQIASTSKTPPTKIHAPTENVTLSALMSQAALQDRKVVARPVAAPQIAKLEKSEIVATKFEAIGAHTLESGKFTSGLTPSLGASFVKKESE